jgi:hypothetical protein
MRGEPAPMPMRARASEFPNDNTALHRGAVWVTNEPCGECEAETNVALATPTPTSAAMGVVGEEWGDDIEVVAELDPLDFDPAASDKDPFAAFVRLLVEVAMEAGCDRIAAILPALLDEGRVVPRVLPEPVIEALLASGMLARSAQGLELEGGEGLRRTAAAWRAILRGDSEDFSSCGPRMLDEWAADLLACLALAPARTEGLRSQLRRRGVAAFGLVLAA